MIPLVSKSQICRIQSFHNRNWKQWKNVKPAGREKGRLTVVCKVAEEEGGKIEEWNEEDEMGNVGDPTGEL